MDSPSEDQKLSSAENYFEWQNYVSNALAPQGAELKSYFLTGSLDKTGLSPEEIGRLTPHYEFLIQHVLEITVSSVLIRRCGGYGSELLQNLRQVVGVVTPRIFYRKVQEILSLNKSFEENYDALLSFNRNFGPHLSKEEFFGYLLLSSARNPVFEDAFFNSPASSNISPDSVLKFKNANEHLIYE
ncbi:hypothetical protein B5S30_g1626 [[Candida] boidinii]|nr:hypothetical protein B5S30_g1626 [[Candida] boidinii]